MLAHSKPHYSPLLFYPLSWVNACKPYFPNAYPLQRIHRKRDDDTRWRTHQWAFCIYSGLRSILGSMPGWDGSDGR